jgi:hypothetical protein
MDHTPPLPSLRSLVFVPALVTLAVTVLRLALELAGGPAWLANNGPGGAGAVLGIVWLPFVFGPWFALRLRPHVASTRALLKPLARTLLLYGFLARLPVFLLTIPAVLGNWGTHYDRFGSEIGVGTKLAIAFGAQMIFWACVWTLVTGMLAGLLAVALRRQAAKPATA